MMNNLLLVDDDPLFVKVVQRALLAAEYSIEVASGVSEAFRKATETPFAVAVVSLDLHEGDGASLVRDLARAVPQTECILLTADPDITPLVDLYDLGNIYNHHWKPLDDLGNLARDIGRALERRALKRQNAYLLSELRDARDELRSEAEFMVQVEKLASLGQMTADLAEELDTPLAALARYANYLRKSLKTTTAPPAGAKRAIGTRQNNGAKQYPMRQRLMDCLLEMEQTAQQGHNLIDNILAYSEGRKTLYEPTDLHEVIHETFGLLRHMLESRGVRVKAEMAPVLPPILASAARIQQALTHLTLNAVHAMPEGGTLTLTTESLPGDTGGARVRLQDTGTGIDPEIMPRIFEPFYTTLPFGQGTGLGLSIARGIVSEHDGQIGIESAVGTGTTITLTFPAAAAESPTEAVHLPAV